MNVVLKKKIINLAFDVLSICATIITLSCVFIKFKKIKSPKNEFGILAAKSIFSRQAHRNKFNLKMNLFENSNNNKYEQTEDPDSQKINLEKSTMPLPNLGKAENQGEFHGEGPTHKIIESQVGSGGTKCQNFYVKNSTGQNVNFDAELSKKPEISIKKTDAPQVLIFHTHTSESYMYEDSGIFYENFYPRSLENSKNVTAVGQAITDKLSENGINTIHDVTYHDNPSYNGSYSRSAQTIKKNLNQYPSIQVVIDIHRDSLGSNESGKIKPTFKYDGKKAAQMMIISGCDPDGSLGFPNWEKNLRLALRLQKYAESMFPGITRPLNFAKVKYNEHMTPGSLLIEVGSDMNTLEEAKYTGTMLGESLAKMLNDLKN